MNSATIEDMIGQLTQQEIEAIPARVTVRMLMSAAKTVQVSLTTVFCWLSLLKLRFLV